MMPRTRRRFARASGERPSVARSRTTPGLFGRPNLDAVEIGQDLEHAEIRHVVTDKNRAALGERRIGHQFPDGGRLGKAGLLDLDNEFAGSNSIDGEFMLAQSLAAAARTMASFGRQPVVQRKRIALVLEDRRRSRRWRRNDASRSHQRGQARCLGRAAGGRAQLSRRGRRSPAIAVARR